jgi:hypothetical protein
MAHGVAVTIRARALHERPGYRLDIVTMIKTLR